MKKRKDGRYCKQILLGYSKEGKRKVITLYGKTIKEVEKKERDILVQIENGIYAKKTKTTLGEWAYTWLNKYKKRFKTNTYKNYYYCISAHLNELLHMPIQKVKLLHLQEIANKLVDEEHYRAAEIFKSTLVQMFEKAVDNNILSNNFALKIDIPKNESKETRRLTDDEIQKVLSLDMPLKTRCFVKLLLCCGLRRGEAWAMEKSRIDIKLQKLYIQTTVYLDINDKRKAKVGKPKTKCSVRVVPIPDILLHDLEMYMQETEGPFLFDGELMSEYKFRKMWKEFKELYMHTYNIEEIDFKPHMFRHTYTSILYGAEVDIKSAQKLLGHASSQTTLDIYTHLEEEEELQSVDKINDAFDGKINISQKSVKTDLSDRITA